MGKKRINPEKLRTEKLKAIPHKEGKLIYAVCVHVYVWIYSHIYAYNVCSRVYMCI